MSKKHVKHADLAQPDWGTFHTSEWAILGTPCGNVKKLSYQLIEALSDTYRLAYVDADHKSAEHDRKDPATAISYGAQLEYVDKINFHRFDTHELLNPFQFRRRFHSVDGVIVNGNHATAKQQIVVVDPKKDLQKKLDRLTAVRLIVLKDTNQVPDFLINHLAKEVPTVKWDDFSSILEVIRQGLSALPKIKGLVLAGGKSVRMGQDKGLLNYHGKPQREHMYDLLEKLGLESYVSVRDDQGDQLTQNLVKDTFLGLGPFGGILSAFREDPNSAWLSVACDQPLLDEATLQFLIDHRNPSKLATCFLNRETNFPEPLITIWEPRAYSNLLEFLGMGYACPRKALINSDVEVLEAPDQIHLKNANTPEEFEQLSKIVTAPSS